jgi:hypothetical protein
VADHEACFISGQYPAPKLHCGFTEQEQGQKKAAQGRGFKF